MVSSFFTSRRGLLAAIWSVVNVLTVVAFAVALTFGMSSKGVTADEYYKNYYQNNNNNNNNNEDQEEGSGDRERNNYYQMDPELAVTSRAMAFAAMWTAVLAVLLSIFGTVILGWQSPTGQYYTCCSSQVHRTTPITLGGFIGSLIMFANLAVVCAALFAEFEVRDYREAEQEQDRREGEGGENRGDQEVYEVRRKASLAFSILCLFLAVVYGAFAALVFQSSNRVLDELASDDYEDPSENKAGLAPGLASPRLSSKGAPAAHFVVRPHDAVYHNHTHSTTSLAFGAPSSGVVPGAPPASQGTLA